MIIVLTNDGLTDRAFALAQEMEAAGHHSSITAVVFVEKREASILEQAAAYDARAEREQREAVEREQRKRDKEKEKQKVLDMRTEREKEMEIPSKGERDECEGDGGESDDASREGDGREPDRETLEEGDQAAESSSSSMPEMREPSRTGELPFAITANMLTQAATAATAAAQVAASVASLPGVPTPGDAGTPLRTAASSEAIDTSEAAAAPLMPMAMPVASPSGPSLLSTPAPSKSRYTVPPPPTPDARPFGLELELEFLPRLHSVLTDRLLPEDLKAYEERRANETRTAYDDRKALEERAANAISVARAARRAREAYRTEKLREVREARKVRLAREAEEREAGLRPYPSSRRGESVDMAKARGATEGGADAREGAKNSEPEAMKKLGAALGKHGRAGSGGKAGRRNTSGGAGFGVNSPGGGSKKKSKKK